ncbi:hypothetical protein [Bacillus sp. FJAT-27264]|nr:hypothetical protein [Bacillus sp. FJAT-27264]
MKRNFRVQSVEVPKMSLIDRAYEAMQRGIISVSEYCEKVEYLLNY